MQVNRPLQAEFAAAIAALRWDVALLQEAPPRWLRPLATAAGAGGASALTSRNALHALRAALGWLNPDLMASAEGGSNQILVRAPWRIEAVRRETLARRPERRRVVLAQIGDAEGRRMVVANLHASTGGRDATARDVLHAAALAGSWAGDLPLIFGGDLNLRPAARPDVFQALEAEHGLRGAGDPASIDQVLARGLVTREAAHRLAAEVREVPVGHGRAIRLSDHPCVAAAFEVE